MRWNLIEHRNGHSQKCLFLIYLRDEMIKKLLKSIKYRPLNAILIVSVLFLYFLNNSVLKNITTGIVYEYCVCYLNDLICPLFFLAYSNLLLITVRKELTSLRSILLVSIPAGLIWEFVAPLMKSSSVTDPIDLICYLLGSLIYWWILKTATARKGLLYD